MPKGSQHQHSLLKEKHMTIQRYRANDLAELFDKITKNSIGLDSYIDPVSYTHLTLPTSDLV